MQFGSHAGLPAADAPKKMSGVHKRCWRYIPNSKKTEEKTPSPVVQDHTVVQAAWCCLFFNNIFVFSENFHPSQVGSEHIHNLVLHSLVNTWVLVLIGASKSICMHHHDYLKQIDIRFLVYYWKEKTQIARFKFHGIQMPFHAQIYSNMMLPQVFEVLLFERGWKLFLESDF